MKAAESNVHRREIVFATFQYFSSFIIKRLIKCNKAIFLILFLTYFISFQKNSVCGVIATWQMIYKWQKNALYFFEIFCFVLRFL